MAVIRLKKLFKAEVRSLFDELSESLSVQVAVQDLKGKILYGEGREAWPDKLAIELEGELLGWVLGEENLSPFAHLLSHLAEREYEKKALGTETLDRYKEINLLYTISQKMASCLHPEDVAELMIQEARKLIHSDSASVMLFNESTNTLDIIAAVGTAAVGSLILRPSEGLAGKVYANGKGEIVNNVHENAEFIKGENSLSSLLCTPLRVEKKTFGVMNISTKEPVLYTAGDLKLATALATQAAVSIENARLHAEELERERIVKELEIAKDIQQSLLPESTPEIEGAELAAKSIPAKEVGGDFYDFIPISEDQLGLVMADVSGKGVPAALFMALSRALMRANSLHDPEVAQAVIQTNHLILECTSSGLFVTLFYAIIDVKQRKLRYISAGHNPPFLHKRSSGEVLMLEADGIALGAIDEIELEEKELSVEEGDVLVLYTDGVTESINSQEEEFGEERLEQLIQDHHTQSARDLMQTIEERVMAFAGDEPQFDDFTLMVLKIV
ncbi:MAG: SpoIIE family protein phosphatase [bacterium]|nr:SpoIIE family protein phosphatase [bacterium]